MGSRKANQADESSYFEGILRIGTKLLYMAKSIRKYLNNNEGVVPMADFLVVRAHILIEDIHLSEPVSAVHEVVFGDIERQSIYR